MALYTKKRLFSDSNPGQSGISTTPQWVKITKTFTDFSADALSNSISIYTLPIKGYIHDVKIVPTTAFSGGTILTYTISVGINGSTAKYCVANNVFTGNTTVSAVHTAIAGMESNSATADIKATATTTVGNLSAATAGSADIYILVSIVS